MAMIQAVGGALSRGTFDEQCTIITRLEGGAQTHTERDIHVHVATARLPHVLHDPNSSVKLDHGHSDPEEWRLQTVCDAVGKTICGEITL